MSSDSEIADIVAAAPVVSGAASPQPPEDEGSQPAGEQTNDPFPIDDFSDGDEVMLAHGARSFLDSHGVDAGALARAAAEPQNDTGNGQRLLHHFGADLLHVRAIGWHEWCGTHWRAEGGDEAVVRAAQQTAARIPLEADLIEATPGEAAAIAAGKAAADDLKRLARSQASWSDDDKARAEALEDCIEAGDAARAALERRQVARRKFGISAGNASRIRGMIDQALPHRTAPPQCLDQDPLAFNVLNGTLYFVERPDHECPDPAATRLTWQVELRPHAREDYIAKLAPVLFDSSATSPRFDAFVERFQPNERVRAFLQAYLGYALTGLAGEQVLVFCFGLGANGKSTLMEAVCRILGDYALTLAFESIAGENGRRGDQATPDLARLPGARLVRASEPERGVQFKESLIKSLTGGEPMLVRNLHERFFEFRPIFKMLLSGNQKPEIGGVDHGIWRRLRLIPWEVTIPPEERRPMAEVLAEFDDERSGILNWLITGTLRYLTEGLQAPPEVLDATADYRAEMDHVGMYVHDCVTMVEDQSCAVSARQMYDSYCAWCYANAVRHFREKSFSAVMKQKGFVRHRLNTGQHYIGVTLHDVPSRPRADQPPHPAEEEPVF